MSQRLLTLALLLTLGCVRYPEPTPEPVPVPVPVQADFDAGKAAGEALLNGYGSVLDSVADKIDSGETNAGKLYQFMLAYTAAARKAAMEPLEAQLDKSSPPDKLKSKPFRDAARGLREANK